MIREISYDAIKAGLKTGDLILFHGISHVSSLIEILEWSYWSHVGMVVMPADIGLTGTEPLLWESTSSGDGIVDVLLGVPKSDGPMLLPLADRISVDVEKQFDNHFKVKYLDRNLTTSECLQLKKTIDKYHSWKFPSTKELLTFYVDGREKNIPSPEGETFCSQLTALTFMALGFISDQYVSNGYCPNDFDTLEAIPYLLPFTLMNGARFK